MNIREAIKSGVFENLLAAVRNSPAHQEEPTDPRGSDTRGHIDPVDGDFDDVTIAWHEGKLTDAEYVELVEAAQEG